MNKEINNLNNNNQFLLVENQIEYNDKETNITNLPFLSNAEIEEIFNPQLDIIYENFLNEYSKGKQYIKIR